VRHLSNASTGTIGIELAREAAARGADVTLVLGPTSLHAPNSVHTVRVQTAREMYEAAMAHDGADLVIASAAVSDWRPADVSSQKVKKSDGALNVAMERNPDILAALGERKGHAFVVGFAAETQAHESNAREKLRAKHIDAIAVNDVSQGRGFGTGESALTLLFADGAPVKIGPATKSVLAARLLDAIAAKRRANNHAARH